MPFYKAGPGLPGDINSGMTSKGTGTKAALKSRCWVAFLSGRPWFAWRQGQPVDDDEINCYHQGGFKKPALGWFFIRPALVCLETGNPGRRQKKTDAKVASKSRRWVAFYKASPGLPGDRQPGDDGLEQPPCFNTTRNRNTSHSGSKPPARLVVGTAQADWRVTRPVRMTWMDPGVPPCPVIGMSIAKRPQRAV